MNKRKEERIGEDIQFGPPVEYYSYRCSKCGYEMEVNEAIIDFKVFVTENDGSYYEGLMPVLGCPGCNHETMEYIRN